MNHKWDYGASDARNARSRRCTACWALGVRYGPGSSPWSTTLPDGTYRVSVIPPCPGTPWRKHTYPDKSVSWVLPSREDLALIPQKIITPAALVQYGREYVEASLKEQGLPLLPEDAWKVLAP
jgi:hypothetical protein